MGNLKITSPLDTTVFKNIRLPFWLRQIFPLHHSTNLVEQVYRALFGERLFGKCILDRGHVHTFDKRTYNYHLDDCYHLVAADCTKRNTHAILAKEKDNVKHVMIFFENHKFVIEEPALRYTRPTTAFTVKMQTGQDGHSRSDARPCCASARRPRYCSLVSRHSRCGHTHPQGDLQRQGLGCTGQGSHGRR